MSRYAQVTPEVDRSRGGKTTVAFFDFDGTLIAGYSVASFLKRRMLSGNMPPREALQQVFSICSYGLGQSDLADLLHESAAALRGVSNRTMRELAEQIFEKDLSANVYPESIALIDAHRRKGHTVVLVSSATQYQVDNVAASLGIENVVCTQLEVEDGALTGQITGPIVYGEAKLEAAREFAESAGADLSKSFFYTDGREDIPLLEAVGRPRPINPDSGLRKHADREGWPVQTFTSRGLPSLADIARTSLVYGSLLPSLAIGLPAWLLNQSMRELANVAISTWGDFGSAVAGLEVSVEGEEHLWSHRPAVFIFNHQSATDALIISRLLRRDFTGVSKAEMKSNLLVGTVLQAIGTVFIDRSDHDKAVEALAPAVESLQSGVSFAIAPEGTRSTSYKLGPFKKGAFHIAMEAGVPIVPIVIANSSDSLPKAGFFIRPTKIDVTVLPPIPTKDWSTDTIDSHIDAIRGKFLEVLGQSTRSDVKLRRIK